MKRVVYLARLTSCHRYPLQVSNSILTIVLRGWAGFFNAPVIPRVKISLILSLVHSFGAHGSMV